MAVESIVLSAVLCLIIGVVAYWKHVLDLEGTITAFLIGLPIGAASLPWLALLLLFLVASFAATRFKYETKKVLGVQEGKRGERGWKNVLANGFVPMFLGIGYSFASVEIQETLVFLYLVALSVAAADTLASEIGVLSDRVYLITDFRRVRQGTNGGISLLGELWAFNGGLFVAVVGTGFLAAFGEIEFNLLYLGLISGLGFLGCHIDSLFGALLENRGLLTKGTNNLLSIGCTVIIAAVIIWQI
ncbi:MAG: DUF92 domain-containing protein [Thermoplasmata archaeon]|nr:DUF92 domain-containing protein [Thermoplasmata archaeon]